VFLKNSHERSTITAVLKHPATDEDNADEYFTISRLNMSSINAMMAPTSMSPRVNVRYSASDARRDAGRFLKNLNVSGDRMTNEIGA